MRRRLPDRLLTAKVFQSTHPKRDETVWTVSRKWRTVFQSTHPKRDETRDRHPYKGKAKISIHSSQAGWDGRIRTTSNDTQNFNPLIPSGMRLVFLTLPFTAILFQSTHPKRDETASGRPTWNPDRYFNPLIPSGMRHSGCWAVQVLDDFNPLIPSGMRLADMKLRLSNSYFNPLIPSGMRHSGCWAVQVLDDFNPLIPSGMRRLQMDWTADS